MPDFDKHLLRLASAIQAGLAARHTRERLELPTHSWDGCVELVRQSRRAELRGWKLAAEQLRQDLAHTLPSLLSELNTLAAKLPRLGATKTMATVNDIYADLAALVKEFNDVNYDVRGRWLSVTTEPITLEGIYLGSFEIRLDGNRIGDDCPYRVIAKDPHPCESRDNVTHPHVMDERLCEGDSRHAIRSAVAQGRVLDFFTLVANGLRSYNSESPFVELAIWHGSSCADCGAVVDEDERYTCQRCEATICGGCEGSCPSCDQSYCSECMTGCEDCNQYYCHSCLKSCRDCHTQICPDCFHTTEVGVEEAIGKFLARQVLFYPSGMKVHSGMLREFANRGIRTLIVHEERCTKCHERQETEDPETSDRTAVQPDRLGQAAVPA